MNAPICHVSIVILHYNDAAMTESYIANIQTLNWTGIDYHIIIVDNASLDGSGRILANKYDSSSIIDVILLSSNEGFARGNNVGINHALNSYCPDLIVVSNNDIIIDNADLPQKLVAIYKSTGYDILGPDVYSITRKYHQSPIRDHYLSLIELNEKKKNIDKALSKLYVLDFLKIYDLLRGVKRIINPKTMDVLNYDKYQEDVVIHGAFFVLSKGYFSAYPDGLYPATFLYMEEDILNYRATKKNLKTVYDPAIQIKHLDGASSFKQSGNRCKKYIFELEQTKISCDKMIEYISG